MAALATPVSPLAPSSSPRPRHLRLVPPPGRHTASRAEAEARRLHPSVYRRRRLGVATVALALGATAWSVLPGGVASTVNVPARSPAMGVHVVVPGDTMWSIARRLQPEGDVRPTVDRLVDVHGSSLLQPGERISLVG